MSNVVSVVFDLPIKKTTSYYKSATSYGRVTTSHRSMSAIYESPFNVVFKFNYKMMKTKTLHYIRPRLYVKKGRFFCRDCTSWTHAHHVHTMNICAVYIVHNPNECAALDEIQEIERKVDRIEFTVRKESTTQSS